MKIATCAYPLCAQIMYSCIQLYELNRSHRYADWNKMRCLRAKFICTRGYCGGVDFDFYIFVGVGFGPALMLTLVSTATLWYAVGLFVQRPCQWIHAVCDFDDTYRFFGFYVDWSAQQKWLRHAEIKQSVGFSMVSRECRSQGIHIMCTVHI